MTKAKTKRTAKRTSRCLHGVVRAFASNPKRIFWIPKLDGTGEYEPAKILRLTVITQPTEGAFYVSGLTNNQNTCEMDLDDVRLKRPNSDSTTQKRLTR